jgi:hypothetical protein
MAVTMMRNPTAMIVSSLTTYNSCETAAAVRPVPSRTAPVFVTSPGDDGMLLMISDARSAGGVSFLEAIPRLQGRNANTRADVKEMTD